MQKLLRALSLALVFLILANPVQAQQIELSNQIWSAEVIRSHGQPVIPLFDSYRPHLHMRGKVMTMEAIFPDGSKEVLSQVNKYNHNWQISYMYADDAKPLLPARTVLQFTSVFDNTANNPINPDPEQWVVFGRRGVDEMSHAWVGITYLDEEQYERAAAERRAQRETLQVSQ